MDCKANVPVFVGSFCRAAILAAGADDLAGNPDFGVGAGMPALQFETTTAGRGACATEMRRSLVPFDNDRGVVTAEAEGIVDAGANVHRPGPVRDIVEVALGVGILVVNGRGNDVVTNRQRADGDS